VSDSPEGQFVVVTIMIFSLIGACKCQRSYNENASAVAAPAPPAPAAAEPAIAAASNAKEVTGGESAEVIIFRSSDTTLAECRNSAAVLQHLVSLFSAVGCSEQNHTSAGRIRFVCADGTFLITPREKPDSAAFEISLQATGDVSAPRKALGELKEAEWLARCGIKFPPNAALAPSLYGYTPESICWNEAQCPDYCREVPKFLAAASKAAADYGCTAHEDDSRVVFTCKKPSEHPTCTYNLDGEVSRFVLPVRDQRHRRAFVITYRGNAVEACPGASYGPASSEDPLFGVGFPNFLVQIRNDCRPRTP
jgi:hypothetical protein